jgi:hypothetical protein
VKTGTDFTRRALAPLLGLALSIPVAGASIAFAPDGPIEVARDAYDASRVQPREITHIEYMWQALRRVGDGTPRRAMDVNTIDEVPDSSWFENRIAARPITIAEIATGPDRGGPAPGRWIVTAAKIDGVTPGLQMKDSAGQLYFVKFDLPSIPERGSGAEVISTKLLYGAGYHVPENYIAIIGREDLHVAPEATVHEASGKKRPMTEADVEAVLQKAARRPDGRYRILASKALPGRPLGPFSYFGVRADDPNDAILHEHRRELRGLRAFAAWLNHVDVKSQNTLDTLVVEGDRRILRHNLVDFNSTLGNAGVFPNDFRAGHEYFLDGKQVLLSLVTLGIYVRPWMTISYPDIPAVGQFEGDRFDPARWKPSFPNRAMLNAQPDDLFWAARRVMAFSDEAIRAVVATAEYSDPRAAAAIADALIKRRDKIGREWLAGVNPLVDFSIDKDGRLTFGNAAVAAGISTAATGYRIQWFHFDNRPGVISPAGQIVTVETPETPVPVDVRRDEYIGADIAALHDQHPAWQRPVRTYFRRGENGWTLVGLERLTTSSAAHASTSSESSAPLSQSSSTSSGSSRSVCGRSR